MWYDAPKNPERRDSIYQSEAEKTHVCSITDDQLIPEKYYPLKELSQWGHIFVDVSLPTEECTPERAAEILLDLRDCCDRRGFPPHTVSLRLAPGYAASPDRMLDLKDFHYDHIDEDGLVRRIQDEPDQDAAFEKSNA